MLHPYPKFNYKMWHADGWIETAHWLARHGYRVVLSGGPDAAEIEYVRDLARGMPAAALNLAGKLTLGGTGYLLSRAALYVGPDTAVTHMAAALGRADGRALRPDRSREVGTVAARLHGERQSVAPSGQPERAGTCGCCQGDGACVPCGHEGCERHISELQRLPAAASRRTRDRGDRITAGAPHSIAAPYSTTLNGILSAATPADSPTNWVRYSRS